MKVLKVNKLTSKLINKALFAALVLLNVSLVHATREFCPVGMPQSCSCKPPPEPEDPQGQIRAQELKELEEEKAALAEIFAVEGVSAEPSNSWAGTIFEWTVGPALIFTSSFVVTGFTACWEGKCEQFRLKAALSKAALGTIVLYVNSLGGIIGKTVWAGPWAAMVGKAKTPVAVKPTHSPNSDYNAFSIVGECVRYMALAKRELVEKQVKSDKDIDSALGHIVFMGVLLRSNFPDLNPLDPEFKNSPLIRAIRHEGSKWMYDNFPGIREKMVELVLEIDDTTDEHLMRSKLYYRSLFRAMGFESQG